MTCLLWKTSPLELPLGTLTRVSVVIAISALLLSTRLQQHSTKIVFNKRVIVVLAVVSEHGESFAREKESYGEGRARGRVGGVVLVVGAAVVLLLAVVAAWAASLAGFGGWGGGRSIGGGSEVLRCSVRVLVQHGWHWRWLLAWLGG